MRQVASRADKAFQTGFGADKNLDLPGFLHKCTKKIHQGDILLYCGALSADKVRRTF